MSATLTAVPATWHLPEQMKVHDRMVHLRVASVHVDGWLGLWPQRLDLLCDLWPRVEADVVLVQGACARLGSDQVLELADRLEYAHVVNAVGLRGEAGTDSSAVLSRLPLMDAHVELLAGPVPRLAAGAVVRIGGRRIRLASVHLPDVDAHVLDTLRHVLGLGRPGTSQMLIGVCLGQAACIDEVQRELSAHMGPRAFDQISWPVACEQLAHLWCTQTGQAAADLDLGARRCDLLVQQGMFASRSGLLRLVDESGFAASSHSLTWADYELGR
jgi:hypothetical protein